MNTESLPPGFLLKSFFYRVTYWSVLEGDPKTIAEMCNEGLKRECTSYPSTTYVNKEYRKLLFKYNEFSNATIECRIVGDVDWGKYLPAYTCYFEIECTEPSDPAYMFSYAHLCWLTEINPATKSPLYMLNASQAIDQWSEYGIDADY